MTFESREYRPGDDVPHGSGADGKGATWKDLGSAGIGRCVRCSRNMGLRKMERGGQTELLCTDCASKARREANKTTGEGANNAQPASGQGHERGSSHLEPNRDQLEIFVQALFRHCNTDDTNGKEVGIVSLRAFYEDDRKKPFRITPVSLVGGLPFLVQAAEDDARRAANSPKAVVFCPPTAIFKCNNGAKEKDILEAPVFSVELDQNPRDALRRLEQILDPATLVVRSGGVWVAPETGEIVDRLHGYWRLKKPARRPRPGEPDDIVKLKRAREIATALVGGDPSNAPVCHPIRWPGSWHRKAEPRLCEILASDPDREIDLDAALARLKAVAPATTGDTNNSHEARSNDGQGRDWTEDFSKIITGEEFHPTLVPLAASCAARGVPEAEALHMLRALLKNAQTTDPQRIARRDTELGKLKDTVRSGYEKFAAASRPSDEWPDPQPLPNSLLPVAAFDYELAPDETRAWIKDVSRRMQCPPDFVAVSTMTALGSLIGRKLAIRPKAKDDWTVVANMWGLLIGRPGVFKSPAMKDALRILFHLEALAREKFKTAMTEYELTVATNKLRHEANIREAKEKLSGNRKADVKELLKEEAAEAQPTQKRYITNDANVASLGVLLQQNLNGLLVFRDEIISLLNTLDQEEFANERGFYLTGWNGDTSHTGDRIGRGLDLHIDGICISLLGGAVPAGISQYLARAIRGGKFDDGLIQRFGLMVWPDISGDWKNVDQWPDREAKAEVVQLFERLDALDLRAIGAERDRDYNGVEEGLPYLRFDDDACRLFTEWRTKLEQRLRSGELHVALEAHLAKYRKLVPGLSLICHVADVDPTDKSGAIGVSAARRAIAWASYLETHAQRAYGSVTAASADTAKAILAKIRSGHLKTEFRSHDVWRPNWSRLTDRDAVNAGLAMLVDYDWLGQREIKTAGRPATVYTVNPKTVGRS